MGIVASSSIDISVTVAGANNTLKTDINLSASVSATSISGATAGTHSLGTITYGASGQNVAGNFTITADNVITSIVVTAGDQITVGETLTFQGSEAGGSGTATITVQASDVVATNGTSVALKLSTISEGAVMNNYQSTPDGANGTLTDGTKNNVRWEITGANTGSGQFSLSIR